MVKRTLPGIGLIGYHELGDTYKVELDENLRRLSALVQPVVKSATTALPGSPALGDIYIVPSGAGANPNEVAIWDGEVGFEQWNYLVPAEGWEFYVADTDTRLRWSGSAWVEVGGITPPRWVTVAGTALNIADSHLDGVTILETTNAAAVTLTVPPGLAGLGPLSVVQNGTGQITFAQGAGVTIRSPGGVLTTGAQDSLVTLVPRGADVYYLSGASA